MPQQEHSSDDTVQLEIERCWKQNDVAGALALVWEHWQPGLYRFALHYHLSPDIADQVVDKAIDNVLRGHAGGEYEHLRAAMFVAVERLVLNVKRSERRHPTTSLPGDAPDGGQVAAALVNRTPDPEAAFMSAEELQRLRDAVDHLPPNERRVVVLHYLEEIPLSVAQIATKFQKNERWVQRLITRSRRRLAQAVRGERWRQARH